MPEIDVEIIIPTHSDGERLLGLIREIKLFLPGDIDVIWELWSEFIDQGDTKSHYHFLIAQQGENILGFACYGRRPLTEGTFDLYWIGVGQRLQGRGIGKLLIRAVEERIRAAGGYLLIAETEGKDAFEPTRRFYFSAGFELEASIRDFYRPGEDLTIFTKHF